MAVIKYLLIIPLAMLMFTVYLTIGLAFFNMALAVIRKFRIDTFILEDFLEEGSPFIWVWPLLFINFIIRMFLLIPLMIAQKIIKPKEKPNEQAAKTIV